jgi:hypothetical protein
VLRQEREILKKAISPAHWWAPVSQPGR